MKQALMFIVKGSMISLLILAILLPFTSNSLAQQNTENTMPAYDESVIVDVHSIVINQTASNRLLVEEMIYFNNIGDENFTGKIFAWYQPDNILYRIHLFGAYIDGSFKVLGVYRIDNFMYTNLSENNVSIEPGGYLQIFYKYELVYPSSVDKYYYGLTILYQTDYLGVKVRTYDKFEVEGKEGLELFYEPDSGMYVTDKTIPFHVYQGRSIPILFYEPSEKDIDYGQLLIPLIFVVVTIIVIVAIYWYKKNEGSEEREGPKDEKRRGSKNSRKVKPPGLKSLEKKKRTILNAIKKLESDHKSGVIDKELYEEMNADYKKKAVEILKSIDKEKQKMK